MVDLFVHFQLGHGHFQKIIDDPLNAKMISGNFFLITSFDDRQKTVQTVFDDFEVGMIEEIWQEMEPFCQTIVRGVDFVYYFIQNVETGFDSVQVNNLIGFWHEANDVWSPTNVR